MIRYDVCPSCRSASIGKVFTALDHTVSKDNFDIWQCAACSLRFTQDVPDAMAIGRYYQSDDYISHSDTRKGLINSLYMLVRNYTLTSKRKFIQRVTGLKHGALLDVGAGTGAFLKQMQSAGWQVQGIEPDAGAIERAATLHGLSLQLPEKLHHFAPQSFDAITLWHVLEHVHDLHEYVDRLRVMCRKNGRIVVAVPNYTSYDAGYYGANWAAYDVPRHLYHFSPAAMVQLMESHGCRVESIHPMWFDSFYVSLLSEKYARGRSSLLAGFWRGLQSNSRAMTNRRKASSVIYVIAV